MQLGEFLDSLERPRRDMVLVRLNNFADESAINYQMIENLFSEPRLSKADWESLISAFARVLLNNEATTQVFLQFCRERSLKGEVARIKPHVIFGRVISQERLCQMLLDMGYSTDPDEASAQLRIHLDILPTELPEDWKEFPMGWHIMWSTFDPDSNFPFGDPLSQGRHILCSSGLGSDLWPVLVLEYNLPNNVEPHIPRFCDAYAGKKQGWIRYFRPAIEGAPYGRTMPTDTCPIQVGRPEVVHVVVKMRNLIRPMRYAP